MFSKNSRRYARGRQRGHDWHFGFTDEAPTETLAEGKDRMERPTDERRRGAHRTGRHEYREGHRGHRKRSRIARFFAHGDLRFLILHLIAEKPRHGYEIIKEIEEAVAGAYTPSPGVVYPTLTLLEELGWVTVSQKEGTKKQHSITPDGVLALESNRTTVHSILARMEKVRAQHGQEDGWEDSDAGAAHSSAHRGANERTKFDSGNRRPFSHAADKVTADSQEVQDVVSNIPSESPVASALTGLERALSHRLQSGDLSDMEANHIATILDTATAEIDRS